MTPDPVLADVLAARDLLAHHLPPTPMWSYPALDDLAGATVFVKHENVQPVGAFKVRGGLTLLAGTDPAARRRGLVTYSTGNHAQSIAYACAAHDVACTVVMPATAAAEKIRAVRALGATVDLHGTTMADAQRRAEEVAADGAVLVSPGDEPALIAGVGTTYLEIVAARPDLDAIVVPIGSGTGAAAAGLVTTGLAPRCRVVGVQSAASPAGHDSWRAGSLVRRPDGTRHGGLATGRGFALPQRLLRGSLGDFLLVTDDDITHAQQVYATHAHTLAEGAGAAALAAVLTRPDVFAGQRIAVVCSGGNASAAELAGLAGAATPSAGAASRG